MTWGMVGAAAVSVVGGAIEGNQARKHSESGGTSGFCACVQAGTKQAIQTAEQVANQPFQAYCVDNAVAGLSGNQKAAQAEAQLRSGDLPAFNKTAGQSFDAQTLSQYENPYVQNVLGAENALSTKNYQTQLADLNSKQGMTSAFGGDRSAIAQSQLTQNYNLNTNLNNAKGLSDAYTQGVSAFNNERNYASGQIGQIEGALSTTGAVCQSTEQTKKNFNYNQFCQQRNWQKNQNAYLTQTLAQVPKGQYYTGNQQSYTTPGGGGWGGALAGAASILGKGGFGGGGGLPSNYCANANRLSNGMCTSYSAATPMSGQTCGLSGGAFTPQIACAISCMGG